MKVGTTYIVCSRPFVALPYKLDAKRPDLPKCVFCDFESYFMPKRCKGGRLSVDENNLRVHCRAKEKMKCAAKCNKNLVFVRVCRPLDNDEVKAYCADVRKHNKAIKKEEDKA